MQDTGKMIKHKGKKYKLMYDHARGHGFFDDVGNWVSKAYDTGKKVISHLKEKKYATRALDTINQNPLLQKIGSYIPYSSQIYSGLQTLSKQGFGEQLYQPMTIPITQKLVKTRKTTAKK